MSIKEILSKRKAELITLAKKLKLRGVFQLPKEDLAKRIAAASAQSKKSNSPAKPRKRSRGVRFLSQRRKRFGEQMRSAPGAKPHSARIDSAAGSKAAGRGLKARPAEEMEEMEAPKRATQPAEPQEASAPTTMASHRFEMPEATQQKFVPEDLGELPLSYATGKMFLTARDPYWLYAYWDFGFEQMHDFRTQARDGTLYLRLYDVTDLHFNGHNAPISQEIALAPDAREWYIHINKPGRDHIAQLGFYEPNGNFRVVSTSRATRTPSDTVSADTRARFVTIPIEIPFHQLVEMVRQYLDQGGQLADVLAQLQEEGYPFPFPTPRDGRWTREQQERLMQYIGSDLLRRIQVGSFEISEWLRRRLMQEMGSAAISSLFSPFGASWSAKKGFWLNVNAEVIIYGATEPDARVMIDGKPVALRPDGTFSFHCAFPDGEYSLPIKAESSDKSDTRAIALQFKRRTKDRKGEVGEVPVFAPIASPDEVAVAK